MIRPATARIRRRSRFGSRRRTAAPPSRGSAARRKGGCKANDFEPHLVLRETVKRQVAHTDVLESAEAVLDAGALPVPVPDLEDWQRPSGTAGVVAEHVTRQPWASVCHSCTGSRRTMTRLPSGQSCGPRPGRAGEFRHPRGQLRNLSAVACLSVSIDRHPPRPARGGSLAVSSRCCPRSSVSNI